MKKHTLTKTLLCGSILFTMATIAQAELLWEPDLSGTLSAAGFTTAGTTAGRTSLITDEDSQTYFGQAGKNYIRFSNLAPSATTYALNALNTIPVDNASALTVASFNLLMKDVGSGAMTLSMNTGSTSNTDRTMIMRLYNNNDVDYGYINGSSTVPSAATFAFDTAVNVKIYQNNSEGTVQYLFNDNLFSLEKGNYTVFLNDIAVLINTSAGTSSDLGAKGNGDGIRGITFTYFGNNSGEILIDNLQLSSFTQIPESSTVGITLGALSLAVIALGRRHRRHNR